MPFATLIQAGLTVFAVIVLFLLFVFSQLLSGALTKKRDTGGPEDTSEKTDSVLENAPVPAVIPEPEEIPIYEKYPVIYRFEILYWRGVSKPWWWNNYAKELVEYANEYFPWNKVNYYSSYNSNSKSEDYNYPPFHDRIVSLRPRKISKHPLVIINWDEEYIMVNSHAALEAMMDRIDAEWYRQYHFKKTYRHSPLFYTV